MKKKTLSAVLFVCILLSFYLNLSAKTSRRILNTLQSSQPGTPIFFVDAKAEEESLGHKLIAQVISQTQSILSTQTQTQSQPQSQTQTQSQTQSQSQSQTQPQTLYLGFPLQVTWKFNSDAPLIAQPQTDAVSVYCVTKSGVSHRVNQENGSEMWKLSLGDTVEEAFLLKEKTLYVATHSGLIFAIDAGKGKEIWRQKVEGENFLTMPATDEKNLFLLSTTGAVVSVDRKTGNIAWKFKALGECRTAPFVQGKELFFGCNDKNLYAVDTTAGFVKWKFTADSEIMGSPIASETDVFFGDERGQFYRVSRSGGQQIWKYKSGSAIRGVPMFYFDEKKQATEDILFCSLDNFIYSLKVKNGGRNWLAGTVARVFNRMHLDRALIFLTPFGSNVFGIDPRSGKRVGEFDAQARIRSSPNSTNERLFIGLNDGKLLCLTRQPPPPPESEETQTQTQTQTQTGTQSQLETEESTRPLETQTLQTQSLQTQTQSQTQ